MTNNRHMYFIPKNGLLSEITKWRDLIKSKFGEPGHIPYYVRNVYSYEGYTMSNGITVFYRMELSSFRQCIMFKIPRVSGNIMDKYSYSDKLHRLDGPAYIDEHGYSFFINDKKTSVEDYYTDTGVKIEAMTRLIKEVLNG